MKQRGTAMNDFQRQALFEIFKPGPLKDWVYEEIVGDKLMRFAQAYLMMARALEYRPAVPTDIPPESRDKNFSLPGGRDLRDGIRQRRRWRYEIFTLVVLTTIPIARLFFALKRHDSSQAVAKATNTLIIC